MFVGVRLLILSQEGELVEEKLLLILGQTVQKLFWPLQGLLRDRLLRLKLLPLRNGLLRPELLLLRRCLLELLLLLLRSKGLPCLLLRLELLL